MPVRLRRLQSWCPHLHLTHPTRRTCSPDQFMRCVRILAITQYVAGLLVGRALVGGCVPHIPLLARHGGSYARGALVVSGGPRSWLHRPLSSHYQINMRLMLRSTAAPACFVFAIYCDFVGHVGCGGALIHTSVTASSPSCIRIRWWVYERLNCLPTTSSRKYIEQTVIHITGGWDEQ